MNLGSPREIPVSSPQRRTSPAKEARGNATGCRGVHHHDAATTDPAAATYLDVSPQTMRNWRSAGSGPPAIKLNGGAIRYRLADLDAWIAAQREDPDAA